MAETWYNSDGLYIKYGLTEGATSKGGQILDNGFPYRIVELNLSYSDFTSGSNIVHDTVVIPKYARVDKVEIVTTTAFDSAADAFVANVGLIRTDRTTTYDADGLVAVLPQASMDPAGDWATVDVNHTYKGALIGTTLAYNGLVVVDYDTAAPTVGACKMRIYYYMTA